MQHTPSPQTLSEDPDFETWMLLQRLAPRAPGIWAAPPTPRGGTPPAMGTLDLVGLLGLLPFLFGGGRGGVRPSAAGARGPIRRPPIPLPPAPEGSLGGPEAPRPDPTVIPKPPKRKWAIPRALEELGINAPEITRKQQRRITRKGVSRSETDVDEFIRLLTPEAIDQAFRTQMKTRHPDVGGTTEDAQRLLEAMAAIRRHRAFVLGEFDPVLFHQYEEKRERAKLTKKLRRQIRPQ